jgi:hypothetical protein
MAITTTDTIKNGSRGEFCAKCKQRKLILRMTDAGMICQDCDPHAADALVRPVDAPGTAPAAPEAPAAE